MEIAERKGRQEFQISHEKIFVYLQIKSLLPAQRDVEVEVQLLGLNLGGPASQQVPGDQGRRFLGDRFATHSPVAAEAPCQRAHVCRHVLESSKLKQSVR